MTRLLSLAILAMYAGLTVSVGERAAGDSTWVPVGPGGGGHQQNPSISPHHTQLYFDGCDMGGFYRSTDRGRVWQMNPSLNRTTSPAIFHPTDPQVIYVFNWYGEEYHHGWRLFRSSDSGRTWKPLHSYVGTYSTNLGRCLAIDPSRPDWLLAGMASLEGEVPGKVLVSHTGGNFFSAVDTDVPSDADVLGLTIDFSSDAQKRRVFAGTTRGVFLSRDGGQNFSPLARQPGDGALTHFASSQRTSGGPLTLYAVTRVHGKDGGLYLSHDGGALWSCVTPALRTAVKDLGDGFRIRAIAANDVNANTLYVSVTGPRYGVYKTEDGGQTFVYQLPGDHFKPIGGHYEAGWCTLDPHFGFGWGAEAMDLAACATDPNLVLWTDDGRTIGTTDGGRTWQQLYTNHVKDNWWSSRGLEVTSAYDVFFDPKNHDRVYATYTDITMFRSEDHGKSWTYAADKMAERNTVYDLAIDPDNPQTLYAANAANHDLPEFKMIRLDKHTFKGGVAKSTDGGVSWSMLGADEGGGLPQGACTAILLDPRSPQGRRALYACAFGFGVYKSSDGGQTWSLKKKGMDYLRRNHNVWRLSHGVDGSLYVAISKNLDVSDKKRTFAGGAVYRSDDQAETWTRVGINMPEEPSGQVNEFANLWDILASPVEPGVVYVAVEEDRHCGPPVSGGVYCSRDKGATWTMIFYSQNTIRLSAHPKDPKRLYAGAYNGLFGSFDGGKTWNEILGLPFKVVRHATFDPDDDNTIWVTTYGGGIWKGPAAGERQ
jgi:photosystem II stability/assembly factor-like uncharacterized protein